MYGNVGRVSLKYPMPEPRKKPHIFLASQSPRRRELLKRTGISFRVVRSTYVERMNPKLSPSRNAVQMACGKVEHARVRSREGFVLGADTFIFLRGRIIGKPRNVKDACRILRLLSGKTHYVYTGLAIRNLATGAVQSSYAKSKVVFKKLSDSAIEKYVYEWRPLDKAGAYAIQEDGRKLIRSIRGSRSNVMGLPMELVKSELKKCLKDDASS